VGLVVAWAAGFAAASFLTGTVSQSAGWYETGSNAPSNFPTAPTLQVSSEPNGISTCHTSVSYDTLTGNFIELGVAGTCNTGDFVEIFTFTSGSATTGSNTVTVYTTYGVTPTTVALTGTLASCNPSSCAGGSGNGASVGVIVDYGTVSPPIGGISDLQIVVS
jgi:hypothetical protein